jgi:uncharacterized protein YycO
MLAEAPFSVFGVGITFRQLASGKRMRHAPLWSHAAIYAGNGEVIEMTVGHGVRRESVWEYCKDRATTLLRVGDPAYTASQLAPVVSEALSHLGQPYGILHAFLAAVGWRNTGKPNPTWLYCSTFVGLCYDNGVGIDLSSDPSCQPLFPGTLASHPDLISVDVEWRRYPP